MIVIDIPGFGELRLAHLVLDFNGTLASDGTLIAGVPPLLRALSSELDIHVVTADTFGRAALELEGLPVELAILGTSNQDEAKLELVQRLGAPTVAAIGNGRNDRRMLRAAALGIAVLQHEGAAQDALAAAQVVVPGIVAALELLTHPLRLVATLRT
ncbi:MAG TPA: ATPase P [Casimicrobiaceae bacterium]|nr:ATPase P [Casimicrobiaceae bacterium]